MVRMIKGLSIWLALAMGAPSASAAGFDYYLLALTWSPGWCASEGDPRDAQCDPVHGLGFSLHGLWPQYEHGGWPEYCETREADPSRRQTAAMADIMGSASLAWYEWKKHGRCSGLSASAYFAAARRVYGALRLPEPEGPATAGAIEAGFLAANPALGPDGVIVTCRGGALKEVRLCLTDGFAPRPCGADVLADACRTRGPLDVPPAP